MRPSDLVVIFDLQYTPYPKWHMMGPEVRRTKLDEPIQHEDRSTLCGELLWTMMWDSRASNLSEYGINIRFDHARKIATMCKRCQRASKTNDG